MKRIGLFGGTFNPIHLGHLRAAQEVREGFSLEEIYLIPSALPPHKAPEGIAEAEARLEMIRLAVSDCTGFTVSNVELMRSGPSYTIDTVHHFKSLLPRDVERYFIVGVDAFLEINLWKSYKALFLSIPFIVMTRPGYHRERNRSVESLGDFLKSRISDRYQYSASQSCFVHVEKQPVYIFEADFLDISSTEIRKRIKEGRSIRSYVPEKVEDFIKKKGLFYDISD
ncbi:nicotinate-nucleotide adenylyltransferase [Desulfobacterales bacterium HSG2]|nr:nicotinate-nucleotide adenylyltransferase [Desulfobacterales bacterium HSG2]